MALSGLHGGAARRNEMNGSEVDLERYFERIGYSGPRDATLPMLREIHLKHPRAIAFENLNSFSGARVSIDLPAIQEKILNQHRGGYCFEQNQLFAAVLRQLGFRVHFRMARVGWMVPEGTQAGRGHMALNVEAEGKFYLCDVGFGGMTLTGPLEVETGEPQQTPHETFRLRAEEDCRVLEVQINNEWKKIYSFDFLEQIPADYEAVNWYVSTHPKSHFVNSLIVARPSEDGRLSLNDNLFTIRKADGKSEKKTLRTAEEIREVLTRDFDIRVPETDALNVALARIAAL